MLVGRIAYVLCAGLSALSVASAATPVVQDLRGAGQSQVRSQLPEEPIELLGQSFDPRDFRMFTPPPAWLGTSTLR